MTSAFLGLAVTLAGFYCIVVAALMGQHPALVGARWYVVGFFALLTISLRIAWIRKVRACRAQIENTDSDELDPGAVLRAWTILVAMLGTISIFLQPLRPFGKPRLATVVATPRPVPTPPPVLIPQPRLPVKFPELKIQGILFQGEKRVAIIDGHAYSAGDRIQNFQIKSVERHGMTLEKDGEEKLIPFND